MDHSDLVGLLTSSPLRTDEDKLLAVFDEVITQDGMVGDNDIFNRIFENLGANLWTQFFRYFWILEHMPYSQSLIDIGCGYSIPARLYYRTRQALQFYIGVDGEVHYDVNFGDMVTSLGSKGKLGRKPVMYIQKDLATDPTIPLPDEVVGLVVSTEFIEHIPEASASGTIDEAYRLLKPGGRFILTTPAAEGYGRVVMKEGHVHIWYVEELRDKLKSVGFNKVDITCGRLPGRTGLRKIAEQYPDLKILTETVPRKIIKAIFSFLDDKVPDSPVDRIYITADKL